MAPMAVKDGVSIVQIQIQKDAAEVVKVGMPTVQIQKVDAVTAPSRSRTARRRSSSVS